MNKDTQSWGNSNLTEMEDLVQKVQQLETENAEQSVLLGKGGERECALLGKVERLERENAALRQDKERLEWLDEHDAEVQKYENSEDGSTRYEVWFFMGTDPSPVFSAPTLRAAIDAAKEGQP